MATIEERAKAFANERWPKENFKSNDRYRREHYQKSRDTYIMIATEQRSIDIDKAKVAYCSACATGLANSKVCRECPCVELGKFTQLLKEE